MSLTTFALGASLRKVASTILAGAIPFSFYGHTAGRVVTAAVTLRHVSLDTSNGQVVT